MHAEPDGLTCARACRLLNGQPQAVCYSCRDFANALKRRRMVLHTPTCAVRKGRVWRALVALRLGGILSARRERVPDTWMRRGWDLMLVYRTRPPRPTGQLELFDTRKGE